MNEKEFIHKWKEKIASEGIKEFPFDFISFNDFDELWLPGKTLVIGEEFFGNHEVLTTDGNEVTQAEDYETAKFIIYSNRDKPKMIKIPTDKEVIKKANSEYGKYLDSILKELEKDYHKCFHEGKSSLSIINEIFKQLNLTRY